MIELIQALEVGGNAALIALVAYLWRLDRRLLQVESFLKHKFKYGG